MNIQKAAIFQALLAAACYGISVPFSKFLPAEIPPTLMASLLYLGAGAGMLLINAVQSREKGGQKEARMTKNEFPYIAG